MTKIAIFARNLEVLTAGERLWIARKAAGRTSYEAAALAGVGRGTYRKAERDENRGPTPFKTARASVLKPSQPVLLALARRRSKLGLEEVAARLGVSRPTILALERAGARELVQFWERKGFLGFRK